MILCKGRLSQLLIKAISIGAYYRFQKALINPRAAQDNMLKKIIKKASASAYGKKHGLSVQSGYEAYKQTIPIVNYNALSPWILSSQTQPNALTSDKIDFFEYTSGSSGAKKSIPYTQALKQSFSNMFKIWAYDCLKYKLKLRSGKIFISISPLLSSSEKEKTKIQDDSDYLQGILKQTSKIFVISQPNIYKLNNTSDFRLVLALSLLAEENLEIISIWSPSYLLVLLDLIETQWDYLIEVLSNGIMNIDNIVFEFNVTRDRIYYLKKIKNSSSRIYWEDVWSNLQMISCWESATAQFSAQKVRKLFENTFVQAKGLLATEAPMTIPIIKAKGFVPLLQDVFFEFEDEYGKLYLLYELKKNTQYEIIISQLAGLYRYRIGDYITVTHYYKNTPCLEFVGRANNVCDMVGEKLNESFILDILNQAPFNQSSFNILVPQLLSSGQGCYCLLTDDNRLNTMTDKIDNIFCKAFHYDAARKMQQLLNIRVYTDANMRQIVSDCISQQGISMGHQKERVLITSLAMANRLMNVISEHTYEQDMV